MVVTLENVNETDLKAIKSIAKLSQFKIKVKKEAYTLENSPSLKEIRKDFQALPKTTQEKLRQEVKKQMYGK